MAAVAKAVLIHTVIATAVLTQNRAVSVAGAVPAAAATALGFAQTGAAVGDATPVVVLGTAVAEAGAAITAGAALELDSSGRVITKASGVTVGRALFAATALGSMVEIILIPN